MEKIDGKKRGIGFKRMTLFKLATISLFLGYMSVMTFVVVKAYSRKSGSTGLKMDQIQKIRETAAIDKK